MPSCPGGGKARQDRKVTPGSSSSIAHGSRKAAAPSNVSNRWHSRPASDGGLLCRCFRKHITAPAGAEFDLDPQCAVARAAVAVNQDHRSTIRRDECVAKGETIRKPCGRWNPEACLLLRRFQGNGGESAADRGRARRRECRPGIQTRHKEEAGVMQ